MNKSGEINSKNTAEEYKNSIIDMVDLIDEVDFLKIIYTIIHIHMFGKND